MDYFCQQAQVSHTINAPSLKAFQYLRFLQLARLRFIGFGTRAALWWQSKDSGHWHSAGVRWQGCAAHLCEDRLIIGS